jgi:hypothetical protein
MIQPEEIKAGKNPMELLVHLFNFTQRKAVPKGEKSALGPALHS